VKPVIRDMMHNDIADLVKFDRLVLGHTLGEETYAFELDDNPFAHYFILEDETNKQFMGSISLWIDTPKAQIINIYVLPQFQGNHLSVQLLDFMFEYIKSYEVSEITLEVRKSNDIAMRLYKKYGFVEVAVRKQYYENGEDAFLMIKRM